MNAAAGEQGENDVESAPIGDMETYPVATQASDPSTGLGETTAEEWRIFEALLDDPYVETQPGHDFGGDTAIMGYLDEASKTSQKRRFEEEEQVSDPTAC
jgi:hypothetical protein